MDQQTQSSKHVSNIDLEKTDSGGWTCMTCIRSRKESGQVSSASTTEDLTQSSTDPIDISSLKEYIDMENLNREQQAQPQVLDVQKSGTWTCIKKCLLCQISDAQEPSDIESSTDPTDFSTSSMKEGIEMDVLGPVQQEPSASADGADSADFHDGPVKNTETANLELKQQDTSSKQDVNESTNPVSPNLALETEV